MKKVFYSQQQFEKDLLDLTRQMAIDEWKPDLIIGPARGGLIPAVYLSHYYNVKMEPVNLSLRDFKTDLAKVKIEIDNILKYKRILVIDDIVDSGETLAMLCEILENYMKSEQTKKLQDREKGKGIPDDIQSHQVKFAALHYNVTNQASFVPDYYANEIDKSQDDIWLEFGFETWWNK